MQLLRIVPMIFVMGAIFFLSHQTGSNVMLPEIVNIDKVAHMVVYGVLAYSMIWALYPSGCRRSAVNLVLATIFFCTLYGISDEYHQSFIPGRQPSLYDVVADGTGALIVSLCWLMWVRKKKSSPQCNRSHG